MTEHGYIQLQESARMLCHRILELNGFAKLWQKLAQDEIQKENKWYFLNSVHEYQREAERHRRKLRRLLRIYGLLKGED